MNIVVVCVLFVTFYYILSFICLLLMKIIKKTSVRTSWSYGFFYFGEGGGAITVTFSFPCYSQRSEPSS